jgi:hypothetical protein
VHFCRVTAAGTLALLLTLACYSPNIRQGAFACGTNRACPDNYHCAANNLCYSTNVDASVEKPACTSFTLPAICSVGHASGEACNPGCQTGCDCGWCGIANGAASCLSGATGMKTVGEICDPTMVSDCKPGLYCQPECGTGRCYQICDPTGDAGASGCAHCDVAAMMAADAAPKVLPFTLCRLVTTCDATLVTSTSCPAPFACYPVGAQTECDCAGSRSAGQGCSFLDDCQGGYSCNGPKGATTCLQTCTATSTCTTGSCNANVARTTYGFCQ